MSAPTLVLIFKGKAYLGSNCCCFCYDEKSPPIVVDALPSPGVNPLEGSPKCSCGKLGLERRSRLPAL